MMRSGSFYTAFCNYVSDPSEARMSQSSYRCLRKHCRELFNLALSL
jgi:hypothetical protein